MEFSLISSCSINGKKPFLCSPISENKRGQPRRLISISCRARGTKLGSESKTSNNFYEVLSLSPNGAGVDEIKKAYRSMALKYHPDVCHPSLKEESARMFVKLNEAYKTLSDPGLRQEYDFHLSFAKFGGRSASNSKVKKAGGEDFVRNNRWQQQIVELKKKSSHRMQRKEGSWGNRLRAQNKLRTE